MKNLHKQANKMFYALPPWLLNHIKGVLLYPMLVYWDQTTLRKQIPIWSNWLWAKTHSRFNKLLICKSNLIYIQDSTNFSWPSKGEGYKNETMLNKSHVTTSGQGEEVGVKTILDS